MAAPQRLAHAEGILRGTLLLSKGDLFGATRPPATRLLREWLSTRIDNLVLSSEIAIRTRMLNR